MLAAKADLTKIVFPIILQPKYDGIRCVVDDDGVGLSRTLKRIPNEHIQLRLKFLQEFLAQGASGLDGELVTYTDGRPDSLYTVHSKVMSADGEPDFKFHIFDNFHYKSVPYTKRHEFILKMLVPIREMPLFEGWVDPVQNFFCENMSELEWYEDGLVQRGWEGAISRKPDSFYKYGRATTREGILLKIKRFEDDEAVIIGFEELDHNENEAFLDERGLQKRTSHKENKVAGNMLGALVLDWNGIEFKVGTGFDEDLRKEIWMNQGKYLGRMVTFKYKGTGPNSKPLIASFKSFRDDVEPNTNEPNMKGSEP